MVLTSVSHKGIVPTLCISPVLVFHHCNTISEENSLNDKGLFWVMVLGVSVHSQLAPFFEALVKSSIMKRKKAW